ncbi:MAG: YjjG family noncanonical pyrimidine nucleotidase [Actinomycetota bacterium]|nr:YjjG family noncanonical pyrimidine nucleotidase [Actinomycetota bacterium]
MPDQATSHRMARYTTVLFDLDHTLLDSDTSEALAFTATMLDAGIENPSIHFPAYDRINRELWAEVEAGWIGPDEVRHKRFTRFIKERNLDADAGAMADRFVQNLGANGDLYQGAAAMLGALGEIATLALVTNGIGQVQRDRIARLDLERYFKTIVISADIGVSKPATGIFEVAFAALGGPSKESALMVGDSLTSDIQGGTNFRIATCWYNPTGKTATNAAEATHEVTDLRQIVDIVTGT